MNDKLAREILTMHADVLNGGSDITDLLTARYPELAPLLQLARSLSQSLEIVPAPAEFVSALHTDLLRTPVVVSQGEQWQPWIWMVGAAVGSAATGLAVWAAHRMSTRHQSAPV